MILVPNPADISTSANITLPSAGIIVLQLYDLLGNKVKDVFSGIVEFGKHAIVIDTRDLNQGEYYLRMEYPGGVKTVKLVRE